MLSCQARWTRESQQESETSWLQQEKASYLAGRLAGRPCPVLECSWAV
ncbi:hypothetical protein A2U01_0098113 [Trifolium medium]|nr:hypothetical protein [Trifolium medium]